MAPLLQELSTLEVQPLEIVVELGREERSLDTLITTQGEFDVAALLPGRGVVLGDKCGTPPVICCCCCPCCG